MLLLRIILLIKYINFIIMSTNISYLKNNNMSLNKDTPFINHLIYKRINDNLDEKNLHIAAFVPSSLTNRWCFL